MWEMWAGFLAQEDPLEKEMATCAIVCSWLGNCMDRGAWRTTIHGVSKSRSQLQFSSVAQSCLTLCDLMNHSTPGLLVHHQFLEFTETMSTELVMTSNYLILCRPLLLLPSIFLSIRVFSNESAFHIRWPKYWSFSFSISPSNFL